MPLDERPLTPPRSLCAAHKHNMFPTAPTNSYVQRPPMPRGPLVPHPWGPLATLGRHPAIRTTPLHLIPGDSLATGLCSLLRK